ncbi:DNA-binding protein [Sulfolobus acidocaldarius SUSAZ]|nr:DNA-binding protein [Sulfolobus acidocaldarius SUSAZ]
MNLNSYLELKSTYYKHFERDELPYMYCKKCHTKFYYPRSVCHNCLSTDLEILISKGLGRIYAVTKFPKMEQSPVFGIIEMEEGFKFYTNVIGKDPKSGNRVKVVFMVKGNRKYPVAQIIE